jgi:transposase-like protein
VLGTALQPRVAKPWNCYGLSVGISWRCDETYIYIKVKGTWVSLYRAVDKAGQTADFYLSQKRDVKAAKAFLRQAMKRHRIPIKITLDAYAASHRGTCSGPWGAGSLTRAREEGRS